MPELPEVESVARQLRPRLLGRRIEAVTVQPQARFTAVEDAAGTRVTALRRRGKYLLAELQPIDLTAPTEDAGIDGTARAEPQRVDGSARRELVMHLGMTGSFRIRGAADGWQPDAYVRATFVLDDGVLDFRDIRRFGRLTVVPAGEYGSIATLAALGPEPLSADFDPDGFAAAIASTRMAVKPYLLTQRAVAGVGNIYADEALWRARISPRARRVGRERAHRLWAAIRNTLAEAVDREGTTFRDYRMVNGASGRNADFLIAYGQAGRPCPRCSSPLEKMVLGGRGTTYCPACQRR